METRTENRLSDFVNEYLVVKEAKCYRHCQGPTKFVPLSQSGSSLVGAYVCPLSYVSRAVYFADKPDPIWFEDFLKDQLGAERVRTKDIRRATRHGWELGKGAEEKISSVTKSGRVVQYYWTFYPMNDAEKEFGTFLCEKDDGGCGRLFTESKSFNLKLCENCRKS